MSVREQQARDTVFPQRTFCLGKQERPAGKMLQSHRLQFFSRGAIKGEGLHGNSLIICWDHFLGMRSKGSPRPAEGQS